MKEREGGEKEERREGKRKGREVTEGGREKNRERTEIPEASNTWLGDSIISLVIETLSNFPINLFPPPIPHLTVFFFPCRLLRGLLLLATNNSQPKQGWN